MKIRKNSHIDRWRNKTTIEIEDLKMGENKQTSIDRDREKKDNIRLTYNINQGA